MSPSALDLASTSRIDAAGAIACAHCTSSAASRAHPGFAAGYLVPPVALTLRNDGGAGNPKVLLNVARSALAEGASYADTIAIVWPLPVPVSPRYARMCAGL